MGDRIGLALEGRYTIDREIGRGGTTNSQMIVVENWFNEGTPATKP